MTAADTLLDHIVPLLRYTVYAAEFSQEKLDEHCKAIERCWEQLDFSYKASMDEVIDYYNKWVKNEVPQDINFNNSELFLFLRYYILVCSLDSYGRCETIEGMHAALERGKQHLNAGLLATLKRMGPWDKFKAAYGGSSKPTIDWMLNMPHGSWFTKLDGVDKEREQEITKKWHEILKGAFDAAGLA